MKALNSGQRRPDRHPLRPGRRCAPPSNTNSATKPHQRRCRLDRFSRRYAGRAIKPLSSKRSWPKSSPPVGCDFASKNVLKILHHPGADQFPKSDIENGWSFRRICLEIPDVRSTGCQDRRRKFWPKPQRSRVMVRVVVTGLGVVPPWHW